MIQFSALRSKMYNYLICDSDEKTKNKANKQTKNKRHKKVCHKANIQILEATQFKNETRHLESKKPDVDSLKEKHKEFIKNNIKITAKI